MEKKESRYPGLIFLNTVIIGIMCVTDMLNAGTTITGIIAVSVSLPDSVVQLNDSIDIPIRVGSLTGLDVYSYETKIHFDTTVLQFVSVIKSGTLSSEVSVVHNIKHDTVLLAAGGTSVMSGSGELLRIRFKTASSAFCGSQCPLEFVHFQFNEGLPAAVVTNGNVYLCTTPPSIPSLDNPPDNTLHSSVTPLLQWNVADRASQYHIQISTDVNFSSGVVEDSSIVSTSFQSDSLEYGTEYFWRVRAKNVSGNSEWSETWSLTTLFWTTIFTEIHNGWNLLSLPLAVDDGKISRLFGNGLNAFMYTPSGYVQVDSVGNGEGFWIRLSADTGMTLVGMEGTIRSVDTLYVQSGWNLIGSISSTVPVNSIVQIPDSIISSDLFWFDVSYLRCNSVIPMKGYWVKVKSNGLLILSSLKDIVEESPQRVVSPGQNVINRNR